MRINRSNCRGSAVAQQISNQQIATSLSPNDEKAVYKKTQNLKVKWLLVIAVLMSVTAS